MTQDKPQPITDVDLEAGLSDEQIKIVKQALEENTRLQLETQQRLSTIQDLTALLKCEYEKGESLQSENQSLKEQIEIYEKPNNKWMYSDIAKYHKIKDEYENLKELQKNQFTTTELEFMKNIMLDVCLGKSSIDQQNIRSSIVEKLQQLLEGNEDLSGGGGASNTPNIFMPKPTGDKK